MSFYRRLEKLRRPGESNREFSARCGFQHPQIKIWIDQEALGIPQAPSTDMVARIAKATGVDAGWLIWGDGND